MVREIAGGFLIVSERTFARFGPGELQQLSFEIERLLKDVRAQTPDLEDLNAVRLRQRTMQRLNSAQMMLRAYQMKRRA